MSASRKVRERSLWAWLRERVTSGGAHAERMENLVGGGFPDVFMCRNGHLLLVELKTCSRPARPSTPLRPVVRPAQVVWHASFAAAGGRALFLVQVGEGTEAKRYAARGTLAAALRDGMRESELALVAPDISHSPDVFQSLYSALGAPPRQ